MLNEPFDTEIYLKATYRTYVIYITVSPVRMLLDHLVDSEQEAVVAERPAHALLVEAKLCGGDGLALWDLREVELKLLVVTPLRGQLPVELHCRTQTNKNNKHAFFVV